MRPGNSRQRCSTFYPIMDTSQKKHSIFSDDPGGLRSVFASRIWAFLLGAWFFDFLAAGWGWPWEPRLLVVLVFAVLFLCTWYLALPANSKRLQKLYEKPSDEKVARIALAVIRALTIFWSAAGWGALVVWFWMIDLDQVSARAWRVGHESMQMAHEKIPFIFWLVIAAAVIFGGWLSYLTVMVAVKTEQLPSDDSDIQSEQ